MVERGVRASFTEKLRFQQRCKGEGIGHASIWGREFWAEEWQK